jgi:hypothetical protein
MYGYRAVLSAEDEREQRQQAFLSRLRKEFLDGPILEFPSAPEMRRNFNPQTLVPLPPHGTYYPNGTFAANCKRVVVYLEGGRNCWKSGGREEGLKPLRVRAT